MKAIKEGEEDVKAGRMYNLDELQHELNQD